MSTIIERIFGRSRAADIGRCSVRPATSRAADIIKWWTYYNGRDAATERSQWTYLYERFPTMPRREIEDIENHTRICVDRLRRLLVNSWRGFEFDNPATGAVVSAALDLNRWPLLLNLATLTAKVTGDAFIKLAPQPEGSPFGPVRLVLLETEAVEVVVSPHDRDDVQSIAVTYDFFEDDPATVASTRHSYREIIDREGVAAFIDDEPAPEYSWRHDLGFIPVAHVKNLDTGGGVYGEPLAGRLTDAQDAVNMLACDLLDIVRYDGHKTTIFQNVHIDKAASRDGMTSGEIDLSIGKGLAVKGEGRVYKLEQQHDLGAALQEYERKLDAFYDLAGVPRISRDLVGRLGSLSGRALERLYQDAIESTREAQSLYGESFRRMAGMLVAMLGREPSGIRTLWNADVITPDVETLAREYELGARSRRSVMRKLGIPDVDAMLREIEEEGGTAIKLR